MIYETKDDLNSPVFIDTPELELFKNLEITITEIVNALHTEFSSIKPVEAQEPQIDSVSVNENVSKTVTVQGGDNLWTLVAENYPSLANAGSSEISKACNAVIMATFNECNSEIKSVEDIIRLKDNKEFRKIRHLLSDSFPSGDVN